MFFRLDGMLPSKGRKTWMRTRMLAACLTFALTACETVALLVAWGVGLTTSGALAAPPRYDVNVMKDSFGNVAGWNRQGVVLAQSLPWESSLMQDPTIVYNQGNVSVDAPIDPTKYYRLVDNHSGRSLSVHAAGTANSTHTMIWDWAAAADQFWQILDAGSGRYKLLNRKSGKALSVNAGGTADSTPTIIYDDIGATDQNWTISDASPGFKKLINQRSGRVLSVLGAGTASDTNTIIYADINAPDQNWTIVPAE
jgi:hypothetical protein